MESNDEMQDEFSESFIIIIQYLSRNVLISRTILNRKIKIKINLF